MYPQIMNIAPMVLEFGRYNNVVLVIWNPAGERSYRVEAVYDHTKVHLTRDSTSVLLSSNDVGVAHFSIKPLTTLTADIQFNVYAEQSYAPHPILVSHTATFYSQVSELLVKSDDPEATVMLCRWKPSTATSWVLIGDSLSNLPAIEHTIVFDRPGDGKNFSCLIKSASEVYVAPYGAQWKLTGTSYDSGWKNSGYLIEGLTAGSYNITFSTVAGWTKPADAAVVIAAEDPLTPPADRLVRVSTGVKTILTQDFTLATLGCLTVQYAQV